MRRQTSFDPSLLYLALISVAIGVLAYCDAQARDVRTLFLDQTTVAQILVTPGRSTILSFPTKPGKVILGNQGVFGVEYVENDLAVAALSVRAHSDLFVYLDGRRFAFNLVAVPSGGDTIVIVRDAIEKPKSKGRLHD